MNAENNKQNILKVPSKNMLMVFSGKEDEVNQKVIREKCFLKLCGFSKSKIIMQCRIILCIKKFSFNLSCVVKFFQIKIGFNFD